MPIPSKIFNYYSEVKSKHIDWLWYPYIPYGKLTIIQGDPGEGKSTFVLDIIARVTNGLDMPDGFKIDKKINVIYQCFEDDIFDTIKPRLESAEANCKKVSYIVDEFQKLNLDDSRIEETIKNTHSRLLVLDPLQSFLQDDINNANKIRNSLGNLVRIAQKYNCAVVLIGHLNKTINSKSIYRGLGSIDITAIARSVLLIERDIKTNHRFISHIKSSIAPEGKCLKFKINDNHKIKWLKNSKNVNNTSLQCRNLIIEQLKNTPKPSSEILSNLLQCGYSERTINKVKKNLGIKSKRKNNMWHWVLPNNYLTLEDSDG